MDHPKHFFVIISVSVIAGILIYRYLCRLIRRSTVQRRFRRGAEGEQEAEGFLKRHGYQILERQARRQMELLIDGKAFPFDIRADFIVRKRGRRCLVEVKTGEKAADPVFTDTRRQLIEYAVSFDVDRICLFDADTGELHEIGLPMISETRRSPAVSFCAGIALGAALTLIFVWLSFIFRCS